MARSSRPFAAPLLVLFALASSAAAVLDLEDVKTWFAFGDSWTSNGYDASRGYNPADQPLKTSCGGKTWFDHVALSPAYPDLRNEHFDFAIGGATIWPGAKAFGLPNVSFPDEVDIFEKYFVKSRNPEKPKWDSATSLFSVFIGINDISYWWWQRGSILPRLRQTLGVYDSQIGRLYKAGARNFLLFKVPPYERSPVVSLIETVVENTRNNVDVSAAALNKDLELYVDQAPEKYPGADFRLFDTVKFFDDVLDNAKSKYGFDNDDGWCPWYSMGMYKANVPAALSLKECGVPLEKYLWYDGVHPTWSLHRLLAAAVQRFLSREARTEQSVQRRDVVLDDFPVDQAVDVAAAEEEYRRLYVRQRQVVAHAPKRFFHLKRTLTPVLG